MAFGKDVKEESDRKRTRPRRIRSRSPEARLRLWQEKLEEANKVIIIEPNKSSPISSSAATAASNDSSSPSKLPFTRFGDDAQRPKPSESTPQQQPSPTSDTFRSLVQ